MTVTSDSGYNAEFFSGIDDEPQAGAAILDEEKMTRGGADMGSWTGVSRIG